MSHCWCAGLVVLWLSLLAAVAQAPSGTFRYPWFDGADEAVWDVSGSYLFDETLYTRSGEAVVLQVPFTLTQDVRGKVTGGGAVSVSCRGQDVPCQYTLKGLVTRSKGAVSLRATLSVKGTAMVAGREENLSISASYSLTVAPSSRTLAGSVRGKSTLLETTSRTFSGDVSWSLPNDMDGQWSLTLTLAPKGTQLAGSAAVLLANGDTLAFDAKGTWQEKSQRASLTLSGQGSARGLSLKATGAGRTLALTSLNGTLLGQALKLTFDRAPTLSTGPGRLHGSRSGWSSWQWGVTGENFAMTTSGVSCQYDSFGRMIREYGSVTTMLTGRTYAYSAYFAYDLIGCLASVRLTASGGLLSPSTQTITF